MIQYLRVYIALFDFLETSSFVPFHQKYPSSQKTESRNVIKLATYNFFFLFKLSIYLKIWKRKKATVNRVFFFPMHNKTIIINIYMLIYERVKSFLIKRICYNEIRISFFCSSIPVWFRLLLTDQWLNLVWGLSSRRNCRSLQRALPLEEETFRRLSGTCSYT